MSDDWREANRRNWDERVAVHLDAPAYDLTALREGRAHLHPIEQAQLGDVAGRRIAHLQCHFGRDSLTLAQMGARVVGIDFSAPAIATARALAEELGLTDRARFVECDIYDAPDAVGGADFDIVFASWGTINWHPDLDRWAHVVTALLRPGGHLHFFEAHPAAMVFDDETEFAPGIPGWFVPYRLGAPLVLEAVEDYAHPTAKIENSRVYEWLHPVSDVIMALLRAGLVLEDFGEHDTVPWRMFKILVKAPGDMFAWPDKAWLPLSYSLKMQKA